MLEKNRVLLVEDDAILRELMTLLLEGHGYFVHAVCHGREAVDVLRDDTYFGLILLDMMMPEMSGLQFLQWLRAECPQPLPVLCMTAMLKPYGRDDALQAGANDIIYKPVDSATLLHKVDTMIGQSTAP
ncbi:MAG: response regulator [Gammaproteobacteria bacterium]